MCSLAGTPTCGVLRPVNATGGGTGAGAGAGGKPPMYGASMPGGRLVPALRTFSLRLCQVSAAKEAAADGAELLLRAVLEGILLLPAGAL